MGDFKGVSAEQDVRFKDKQAKLLKSMKFPKEFEVKVDTSKVNFDVLRPLLVTLIVKHLNVEDDVLIEYVFEHLTRDKFPDPKLLQINLTGFFEASTPAFMVGLWNLLKEAQEGRDGIPQRLVDEKKEQLRLRKEEDAKIQLEIRRQREKAAERTTYAQPHPDIAKFAQRTTSDGNINGNGKVSDNSAPAAAPTAAPAQRRNRSRSRSASPPRARRDRSRSRSPPRARRDRSRSRSPPRRNRSRSRSRSPPRRRRSRSPPSYRSSGRRDDRDRRGRDRSRSRSRDRTERRRSRSRSRSRDRKEREKSPKPSKPAATTTETSTSSEELEKRLREEVLAKMLSRKAQAKKAEEEQQQQQQQQKEQVQEE